MTASDQYELRQIADTWVLVPIGNRVKEFNGLITLNETGVFIWNLLKQNITLQELVVQFQKEYQLEIAPAKKDVEEFLQQLIKKNLLE